MRVSNFLQLKAMSVRTRCKIIRRSIGTRIVNLAAYTTVHFLVSCGEIQTKYCATPFQVVFVCWQKTKNNTESNEMSTGSEMTTYVQAVGQATFTETLRRSEG